MKHLKFSKYLFDHGLGHYKIHLSTFYIITGVEKCILHLMLVHKVMEKKSYLSERNYVEKPSDSHFRIGINFYLLWK